MRSATGLNMANHAWTRDHKINFDNGHIINKRQGKLTEVNYRQRKTLQSWHTTIIFNVEKNSKTLPEQYTILLKKKKTYPRR